MHRTTDSVQVCHDDAILEAGWGLLRKVMHGQPMDARGCFFSGADLVLQLVTQAVLEKWPREDFVRMISNLLDEIEKFRHGAAPGNHEKVH